MLPKIDGIVSDLCLFVGDDGVRYVGYYHVEGHWFYYSEKWFGTSLFSGKVVAWEYLNPPSDKGVSNEGDDR